MGDIFRFCIEDLDQWESIVPSTAPLLLLRVCKRWRRIAFGTSRLFTRLVLIGKLKVNPCLTIPMWLRHSKSLAFDVLITPDSWRFPGSSNSLELDVTTAIQLVAQNFQRCRIFRSSDCHFLRLLFPSGVRTDAPVLVDIQIFRYLAESAFTTDLGEICAPHLEAFRAPGYHPTLALTTFNYYQLRIFRNSSGENQTLEDLAQLLSLCPNLEECNIGYIDASENEPTTTPIELPHLRYLCLTWNGHVCNPCEFLESLGVPRLEHLDLAHDDAPAQLGLAPAFHSLVAAPTPPLKDLRLASLDIPVNDLLSILKKLESLESLSFQGDDGAFDDAILAALTPDVADPQCPWMCPKLSSVYLSCSRVSGPQLIRMITGRLVLPGPPLGVDQENRRAIKRLQLSFCRGLTRLDVMALRQLQQSHSDVAFVGLENIDFEDGDNV